MKNILIPLLLSLGAAFASPALMAADAPAAATPASVEISKFAFAPKELTVAPGTTVRWTNHDQTPHTVASQDASKTFASKALDTDDQFEFTFTKEGDYNYLCTVHPMMTAIVHVKKP